MSDCLLYQIPCFSVLIRFKPSYKTIHQVLGKLQGQNQLHAKSRLTKDGIFISGIRGIERIL